MTLLATADAPVQAWLEAARVRKSRRSYDGTDLAPAELETLEELAHAFRPNPIAHAVVLRSAPNDIFTGIVGSYGRVTGAPVALAFVGTDGAPGVEAAVGYTGEALVLEANRLGLSTCWVAGSFKPHRVGQLIGLGGGERVFAISPVGHALDVLSSTERVMYGTKADTPKPRKTAEEIAPDFKDWIPWARSGVEAARIAPSAMNRQPWRFRYEDGEIVVGFDGVDSSKVSKRLDCGIAMLHFELGARHAGAPGEWELLDDGTDVARYRLV